MSALRKEDIFIEQSKYNEVSRKIDPAEQALLLRVKITCDNDRLLEHLLTHKSRIQ